MNFSRRSSLILAGACSLILSGCPASNNNSSNAAHVAMSVQPLNSAYYTSKTNGPRYSVISLQNPSSNSSASINNISKLKGSDFKIINHSNQQNDPYYGAYSQCATSANSNLYQVNTLASGGQCIIVLKGKPGSPANAPSTATLSITATSAKNITNSSGTTNSVTSTTTQNFNLTNTTYLYAGGLFSTLGNATSASDAWLLAKCNNGSCENYFNNSVSGATGPTYLNGFTKIAVDSTGNVYVTGSFSSLGSITAVNGNLIAKCAYGTCQNYLSGDYNSSGANSYPNALAFDSAENLYVGGASNLSTLGGASASPGGLLAQCTNGVCQNYFGTGSSMGPTSLNSQNDLTGGSISDIVSDQSNGDMYVGGVFSQLGNGAAGNLDSYNTQQWLLARCAQGSCYNYFGSNNSVGANGAIVNMLLDGNGSLYLSGYFSNLGNASAAVGTVLAKCTNNNGANPSGTCQSYFGQGSYTGFGWGPSIALGNLINAMTMDNNGNLYLGGNFSAIGTPGNLMAQSTLGSNVLLAKCTNGTCQNYFDDDSSGASAPAVGNNGPSIDAMVTDAGGNLYVAGNFTQLGSVTNASNANLLAECPAGGHSCTNYLENNSLGANNLVTTLAVGNEISVVPQQ